MKTLYLALGVFVFLVCGLSPARADDPRERPKWVGDLFEACMLYNGAIGEIDSNPAAAIKALTEAQQFCIKAHQDGCAQHVDLVTKLIGKALLLAETESQKAPTETADSKQASQPQTPAVNTPVYQLGNKTAKHYGPAHGTQMFARSN